MKKLVTICLILFFSSSLFSFEIDSLWEKRATAQIQWQNDFADLLLEETPKAKEIILISRDLQIVFIKLQKEKYYYLLENHPSKIIRTFGQSHWVNFDWSDDDEKKLLEISENYVKLTLLKNSLKSKNQGHPLWSELKKTFIIVQGSEGYQKTYNKFMESLKEIDERLHKK